MPNPGHIIILARHWRDVARVVCFDSRSSRVLALSARRFATVVGIALCCSRVFSPEPGILPAYLKNHSSTDEHQDHRVGGDGRSSRCANQVRSRSIASRVEILSCRVIHHFESASTEATGAQITLTSVMSRLFASDMSGVCRVQCRPSDRSECDDLGRFSKNFEFFVGGVARVGTIV